MMAASVPVPCPPAPAVVVFQRSEDDLTRVTLASHAQPAASIDPRVFSNFLEHLGGSVYEALWANVIYNPQFEAERDGMLARWSLNGAQWLEGGVRGRYVRCTEGTAVVQRLTLPTHRVLRYRGTIWVRSLGSKHPVLTVSLRKADGTVLAEANIRTGGSRWLPRRFDLRIAPGAVSSRELLDLELKATVGEVDADMLEVFPADAVDGVDPDVLRIARSLRIELLRWPGGNFVSGYRWKQGIGLREQRPTTPNPAWGGLETHHFGTDEFMAFCRRIGARPQICINAGNGTPEEAAAWVAYCNAEPGTPMGSLRAANGHPEPYNVRVWEIGNELYGDWQIGHTDAAGNARRFEEFRSAMLAVDPTIEIIATGKGDQFTAPGLEGDRVWNSAVLDAATASGGPPDYLSLHPLLPLPLGLDRTHTYEEIYLSAMAHPHWWSQTFVPDLRTVLADHGGTPQPRVAVTEWGIIIGGPNWHITPNHDHQSGAVYAALFFHAMFRAHDLVAISNTTALMHGGCIRKDRSLVFVLPMVHVSRLYGQARPSRLIPVTVSGPAYDVPQRGIMPAAEAVPWVDVVAGENKGRWTVMIVNRDPSKPRTVEITAPRAVSSVTVETLAGDPRSTNTPEDPDHVAPTQKEIEVNGKAWSMEVPPSSVSIVALRFRR